MAGSSNSEKKKGEKEEEEREEDVNDWREFVEIRAPDFTSKPPWPRIFQIDIELSREKILFFEEAPKKENKTKKVGGRRERGSVLLCGTRYGQ